MNQPPYLYPPYVSSRTRAPLKPLVLLPRALADSSGPVFGHESVKASDSDLTRQHTGAPIGERIAVGGRVLDEDGKPVRGALIELWQCNAAGRYAHERDTHDAPLDPNFSGCGRALSGSDGRYQFFTIKPAAYPWRNHENAWRPAHIHYSLFGQGLLSRLVTQMYFPGDPLLAYDPIYQSTGEAARNRLVAQFDLARTTPEFALGYNFDIVLRGGR